MFTIQKEDFRSLVLPRTAAAAPSDNDGVHLDSEPHIQKCIIEAAARVFKVEAFSQEQLALVRDSFGRPDNHMSMRLFSNLKVDPELGQAEVFQRMTEGEFVPYFVEARREVWEDWTSSGQIDPKPGVFDYFNELRSSGRKLGLVTGMPYDLVRESVRHVLKADDLIPETRARRVCCDDPRLGGKGKPDPLCYELGLSDFVDEDDIDPRDMWVIEDRANGAVAALAAEYRGSKEKYLGHKIGHVIVIPDEHDVNPVALWDSKNLVEQHLARYPEDRHRLYFVPSLRDLSFAS